MPSDCSAPGAEEDHGTGRRSSGSGPVFTNPLLADGLNRTPPKTQAALLEAMQEHTVSFAGVTHRCRSYVLATQNPIGSWHLSAAEAQLDRFLLHIALEYPDEAEGARSAETGARGRGAAGDGRGRCWRCRRLCARCTWARCWQITRLQAPRVGSARRSGARLRAGVPGRAPGSRWCWRARRALLHGCWP